jgi:phage-related protein
LRQGFFLRRLQRGEKLAMPESKPMPDVGRRCQELRIVDGNKIWRIMYRVDEDATVILEVFQKQTRATPQRGIDNCKKRLKDYGAE